LFQMIAKNVGIRRARGEYILASNIDILFSDELMAFFASGKLRPNVLYRIDRHDIDENVPTNASVQHRLAYCRKHIIRVNKREGTFPVEKYHYGRVLRQHLKKWCRQVPTHLIQSLANITKRHQTAIARPTHGLPQEIPLHTTACGDFTLLDRDSWFRLRGYPELEIFSLHIDSLFCHMARHAGISELVLQEPMRSYHIEHGKGSGWTPEGATELFGRMSRQEIPVLTDQQLCDWVDLMGRQQAPILFNTESWGLKDQEFQEARPTLPAHAVSTA